MNEAQKASKAKARAKRRKAVRQGRELYHLRGRDLKGKPRLYPLPQREPSA